MENDTIILLKLYDLYKIMNDKNQKKIIKRLIDKIKKPFIVNFKEDFEGGEITSARKVINKICNYFLYEDEQIDGYIYKNNHWLYENDTYNNLCLLIAKLYKDKKSPLYKNSLELLKIYAKEELEITIKKHYKL